MYYTPNHTQLIQNLSNLKYDQIIPDFDPRIKKKAEDWETAVKACCLIAILWPQTVKKKKRKVNKQSK